MSEKIDHDAWVRFAAAFRTAQPSSPQWFAMVDAAITYLVSEKILETMPESPHDRSPE